MPIVAKRNIASPVVINRPDVIARPRVRRPVASPPPVQAQVAPTQSTSLSTPATPVGGYKPGYKCPPRHSQFKKGKSGNAKGRPKGAKGIKTIARKLLTEKVTVRTATGPIRMTKIEAMLHKIVEQAFAGNLRALQQIITLYDVSVPDEPVYAGPASLPAAPILDQDAHDEAILASLRAIIIGGSGGS